MTLDFSESKAQNAQNTRSKSWAQTPEADEREENEEQDHNPGNVRDDHIGGGESHRLSQAGCSNEKKMNKSPSFQEEEVFVKNIDVKAKADLLSAAAFVSVGNDTSSSKRVEFDISKHKTITEGVCDEDLTDQEEKIKNLRFSLHDGYREDKNFSKNRQSLSKPISAAAVSKKMEIPQTTSTPNKLSQTPLKKSTTLAQSTSKTPKKEAPISAQVNKKL